MADPKEPIGISEIQCESDMVTLLDKTIEELDDDRFVMVVVITKKGGFYADCAGRVSELELEGLTNTLPCLVEGFIEQMFYPDNLKDNPKNEDKG